MRPRMSLLIVIIIQCFYFKSYEAFITPKPQLQRIGNIYPTFYNSHSKSTYKYKSLNNQISNENNRDFIDSDPKQVSSKEENNNWTIIAIAGAVSTHMLCG
jgi:hypothetical protein